MEGHSDIARPVEETNLALSPTAKGAVATDFTDKPCLLQANSSVTKMSFAVAKNDLASIWIALTDKLETGTAGTGIGRVCVAKPHKS
jgi:hypothetical protein